MLAVGKLAKSLEAFITKLNSSEQKDPKKSIKEFCEQEEKTIYDAIRSITITIPSGSIVVTTPQGPGTNTQPIVLQNVVK